MPEAWRLVAKDAPREHSSTHVLIPPEIGHALTEWARATIDPDDIHEDPENPGASGFEDDPHVTVKYGLTTPNPLDVAPLFQDTVPFIVSLGKTRVFGGKENDKPYDVLYVAVDSLDLHELHRKISENLENEDSHPNYTPHACLAYVKVGTGEKYEGLDDFAGLEFEVASIEFSSLNSTKTSIPFGERTVQGWRLDAGAGRTRIDGEVKRHSDGTVTYTVREVYVDSGHVKKVNRYTAEDPRYAEDELRGALENARKELFSRQGWRLEAAVPITDQNRDKYSSDPTDKEKFHAWIKAQEDERDSLVKQFTEIIEGLGPNPVAVFPSKDGKRAIVVHNDTIIPGNVRTTYFDEYGPSGHDSFKSLDQLIGSELIYYAQPVLAPEMIDAWEKGEKWKIGHERLKAHEAWQAAHNKWIKGEGPEPPPTPWVAKGWRTVGSKEPWEMPYTELRQVIAPHDKEGLAVARPLLQILFPEYATEEATRATSKEWDPWGIYRSISRGDELPRVPMTDLSQRHRKNIIEALQAGQRVPPEVLADYPDIQTRRKGWRETIAKEPWEMTRAEFIEESAERNRVLRQYIKETGEQFASSRTTPQAPHPHQEGAWVMEGYKGPYGSSVGQLRTFNPEDLIPGEDTEPFKMEDVDRYVTWAKEGKPIPPISVVEQDNGKFAVTDGHRRWLAAKRLKIPIQAWVWPRAYLPGKTTYEGKPMPSPGGLTHELSIQEALRVGKPVPPEVLADYPGIQTWVLGWRLVAATPSAQPSSPHHEKALWIAPSGDSYVLAYNETHNMWSGKNLALDAFEAEGEGWVRYEPRFGTPVVWGERISSAQWSVIEDLFERGAGEMRIGTSEVVARLNGEVRITKDVLADEGKSLRQYYEDIARRAMQPQEGAFFWHLKDAALHLIGQGPKADPIVAAAIKWEGVIYTGPFHSLIIDDMPKDAQKRLFAQESRDTEGFVKADLFNTAMGFVTKSGRFLNRYEAAKYVGLSGSLLSEDVTGGGFEEAGIPVPENWGEQSVRVAAGPAPFVDKAKVEITGSHHGQIDGFVYLLEPDAVGKLDFSEFQGEVYVNMIEVREDDRRKGVGRSLYERLKQEFPGQKINHGLAVTDAGSAFSKAVARARWRLAADKVKLPKPDPIEGGADGWISPDGGFYKIHGDWSATIHAAWSRNNLGLMMDEAMDVGWVRFVSSGKDLVVHAAKDITPAAWSTLEDLFFQPIYKSFSFEYNNLWSSFTKKAFLESGESLKEFSMSNTRKPFLAVRKAGWRLVNAQTSGIPPEGSRPPGASGVASVPSPILMPIMEDRAPLKEIPDNLLPGWEAYDQAAILMSQARRFDFSTGLGSPRFVEIHVGNVAQPTIDARRVDATATVNWSGEMLLTARLYGTVLGHGKEPEIFLVLPIKGGVEKEFPINADGMLALASVLQTVQNHGHPYNVGGEGKL